LFVAGFIGPPPMNFIEVRIKVVDDAVFVEGPGFSLRLPPEKAAAARPYDGKQVVFGIRPNDIYGSDLSPVVRPSEDNTITVTVDVVEPMGAEAILYLSAGGLRLVASVDSATHAAEGDTIQAVLDLDRAYLFDPDTEHAIFTAATGMPHLVPSGSHGTAGE
ncbi:MAG: ABC transporter ATP-binding protein, partial [Armatimonadetes bacterium]|nr:ABC transporter ATP-binding protein [Armatimonadota bacterium]